MSKLSGLFGMVLGGFLVAFLLGGKGGAMGALLIFAGIFFFVIGLYACLNGLADQVVDEVKEALRDLEGRLKAHNGKTPPGAGQ
jgi:hypothetical protein